ncbi:hypothetical protein N665_0011s0105 [Sinapis alba]|nr:hypothetical protein N665_0011s0105 [Sinapis alba]
MVIAQPNIDFLGMQITDDNFSPQAHLATTLLDFPDENLTKRQVQQFFVLINYVDDFIPQLSQLTRPLQKMLTKNPPQWINRQIETVRSLKVEVKKLPPLKIHSTGTHILHTDASEKYWGDILFEEINRKRQICGYKSRRFKDSEMHYHSTFKEILAVKKSIEKNPVKEIKIMETSSARSYYDFTSNMPDDAHELINKKTLHERLLNKIFFYQSIILSKYGISNHLISPM